MSPTRRNCRFVSSNRSQSAGSKVFALPRLELLEDRLNPAGIAHATVSGLDQLSVPARATSDVAIVDAELLERIPQSELRGSKVIAIDDHSDPIGQIDKALEGFADISVLRVISHGESGAFWLGGQRIDMTTLREHTSELKSWSRAMTADADLLLYGCAVAATADGLHFIENLADLTGADVGASNDITGTDGDLILERATGPIENGLKGGISEWSTAGVNLAFTNLNKAVFYAEMGNTFTLLKDSSNVATFQLTKGQLPGGVTFDPETGVISGTPLVSAIGTYALTFSTPDGAGQQTYQTIQLEVKPFNSYQGFVIGSTNGVYQNRDFSAALNQDGSVTTWAHGNYTDLDSPVGSGFVQITPGGSGFAALKQDGSIVAWGLGTYLRDDAPKDSGYVKIFSSGTGFCALRSDGSIYSWDMNHTITESGPKDAGYIDVVTNGDSFAAIKHDGTLFIWGNSFFGSGYKAPGAGYRSIKGNDLGFSALRADGSIAYFSASAFSVSLPPTGGGYTEITNNFFAFSAVNSDGKIVSWGNQQWGGYQAPVGGNFVKIFAGTSTFSALRSDGSIASWGPGRNWSNTTPTDTGYTWIYTNGDSFAAIKGDGSISVWGDEYRGGLDGPTGNGYTTVVASDSAFAALRSDGAIYTWGLLDAGYQARWLPGSGYAEIYGTSGAFLAEKSDGSLFGWGHYANDRPDDPTPKGNDFAGVFTANNSFAVLTRDGVIIHWDEWNSATTTRSGYLSVTSNRPQYPWFTKENQSLVYLPIASEFRYQLFAGGYSNTKISLSAGMLPSGISFDPVSKSITGVTGHKGIGELSLQFTAKNDIGSVFLSIKLKFIDQIKITSRSQATFLTDSPLNFRISISKEIPNPIFALLGGPLPKGITFDPLTGALSGTPQNGAFGDYRYQVSILNWGGKILNRDFTLSIYQAPELKNLPTIQFTSGEAGTFTILATGSPLGLVQITNGALPAGMTFDSATGIISGKAKPGSEGSYPLKFTLNTGYGQPATSQLLITVVAKQPRGFEELSDPLARHDQVPNDRAFAALTSDGSIFSWGDPSYGGTGAPSGKGFVRIYTNRYSFAALRRDGSIAAWGDAERGGSGTPSGTGYIKIFSNGEAFAAITEDGTISSWGDFYRGGKSAPPGNGYVEIIPSSFGFAALKADGSIVSWGKFPDVVETVPAPINSGYIDVVSTYLSFAALNSDGSIRTWGASYDQHQAPTDSGYIKIYANSGAFAALKSDGTIRTWGQSDSRTLPAPTDRGYISIVAAGSAFAALKSDGTISIWGNGSGLAATAPKDDGYVKILGNDGSLAAIKLDGSISTWGYSDQIEVTTPPIGSRFIDVYHNGTFLTAQLSDGTFRSLGSQEFNTQPPAEKDYQVASMNFGAIAALNSEGTIAAWGDTSSGGAYVPTGSGYRQVFSTTRAFAAIDGTGNIAAWGDWEWGANGAPTQAGFVTIASPYPHAPWFAVDAAANLKGQAGQEFRYQLPIVSEFASTFSVEKGSLPEGISLDSKTGLLSGSAKKAGTYSFSLFAANIVGDSTSKQFTLQIVQPYNDPPTAGDKSILLTEDTFYRLKEADFGFSDSADQPANGMASVKIITLPGKGLLTLFGKAVQVNQEVSSLDIRAGKLVYTPVKNMYGLGVGSFSFKVRDNGGIKNGGKDLSLTPNFIDWDILSVNDAPSGKDKIVTIKEDASYQLAPADFGFCDGADTPANRMTSVVITGLPSKGILKFQGIPVKRNDEINIADIASGSLLYVPGLHQFGNAYTAITFRVRDDGGKSNGGTDLDPVLRKLTWNVLPVNHAPVGTDKAISILEDSIYRFKAIDFGFKDPDDLPQNALTSVVVVALPGRGQLLLAGKAVKAGQEIFVQDIVASKLAYSPSVDANGSNLASFPFRVRDNGGTANGGVNLALASNQMTLDIVPVNDAPSGTSKTMELHKGQTLVLTLADFGSIDSKDLVPNGLNRVQFVILPASGKGQLTLNGAVLKVNTFVSAMDIIAGKLKFTLPSTAKGKAFATFSFKVEDDGGIANGGKNLALTANSITINVA